MPRSADRASPVDRATADDGHTPGDDAGLDRVPGEAAGESDLLDALRDTASDDDPTDEPR